MKKKRLVQGKDFDGWACKWPPQFDRKYSDYTEEKPSRRPKEMSSFYHSRCCWKQVKLVEVGE